MSKRRSHMSIPQRVHMMDGWELAEEDGRRWRMIHATAFCAFQRWLRQDGYPPVLYEGFDGYRIFTSMSLISKQAGWPELRSENYPNFYQRFDEFQRWLTGQGKRGEFTGLVDCVPLGWDLVRQRHHVGAIVEILSGTPHLFELANENAHPLQRVDSTQFSRPTGVFACAGSSLTEGPCPLPAWDYSAAHLARRIPACFKDASQVDMILGYPGYPGTQGPTVTNEMIGADEQDDPGRRSADPYLFRRIAESLRWVGGTFHSQAGIFNLPLGPRQALAAAWFTAALR